MTAAGSRSEPAHLKQRPQLDVLRSKIVAGAHQQPLLSSRHSGSFWFAHEQVLRGAIRTAEGG
jgi:hypothetical protein